MLPAKVAGFLLAFSITTIFPTYLKNKTFAQNETKQVIFQGFPSENQFHAVSGKALLDAPLISQYPELPSGCEATALAMALQYYGVNVSKIKLANEMPYDPTPIKRNMNRAIIEWGDPEVGYVGNPYGLGTTINPAPLKRLLDKYRPGGLPLYGKDFAVIENYVQRGKPTLVWFTLHYKLPTERTWKTPQGKIIDAPTPLHCVLVTGTDANYVYFHDSDAGKKHVKVPREQFIKVYHAMGRRALVVN